VQRRDILCPGGRAVFGLALLCFCLAAWSGSVTLLPPAGQGMFLRGLCEASAPDTAAWRQPAFDDRDWEVAQFPLFHGLALGGTRLSDMPGRYTSVYVRRYFVVKDPAEIVRLELGAVCDGGYVAWINGQEVRRSNVRTGDLTFDDTALSEQADPVLFEAEEFETWRGLLVAGTNVLALQAFSSSRADDADFVFDASLVATIDEDPPVIEAVEPPPGSVLRALHSIEVQFSEPVVGVDAADLLVNGNPAIGVVEVVPGDFLFTVEPPGDGQAAVAWRADHGITDAVGARHPFVAKGWSYLVDSASPSSALVLSEFMADNKRTLNDEDGDSSDWIEIHNSGSDTASLAGWFLTDDPANLTKWCFPEIELVAGGYRVVFASGKDRTNPAAKLHTNFKLSAEGGFLALVDPAGQVVSQFGAAYPRQVTDVSYGWVLGEGHALGYFTNPTPGAPNASSGPGFAPKVQFSRAGGTFTNPFSLSLSSSLSGALIRYTLDGNLPTNGSTLYEGPIEVTNSLQVRARAFADGLLPGPPRSEGYVLLATNVLGFTSDLPVLVLHSHGKGAPNSTRLNFAQVCVFEPKSGRTRLTDEPALSARAGVQIRGSSTEGLAKSSYKLELWDEFGMDQKHPLLGLPAESDWVLYAPNQFEPVLIHNPFIHQISRDMGRYSPRTRFVEVYFNRGKGPMTSTHYAGIYVLEEKIKIGRERLAIDKLEPENLAPPSVTGGYLLKIDRLDPGDVGLVAGGVTLAYVDPKEREIRLAQRRPQQNYIRDYVNAFYKALMATNWLDARLGYRAYIDVEAAIDYHVLEVLSGNVDALVLSAYLHKPRNGKITFGPHWDFDRALGSTDGRDSNPRLWATGPFFSAAWWNRMFTDKDFWQRWVDRWQELRESHFSLNNLHGLIDRLAAEVRQAQPREFAKWRIGLRGGSYESEVRLMKNWLSNRIDFIDRQLTQPPRFSRLGGSIAPGFVLQIASPPNASVYYTLDGSDPRLSTGGVSAGALSYTGPITLDRNARVIARAHDPTKRQTGGPPAVSSTPWSRPVAATFVVSTPRLVITEIMFHPEPPPKGDPDLEDEFEYLELSNLGLSPIDLPGFRLTNGVEFAFTSASGVTRLAPGERVLVVKNQAAFLRRYPGTTRIAGEYTGTLHNASDRLTLLGPLEEPISDFVYHDAWAPLADGFGFALVLADETTDPADLGDARRWRLSATVGGSPGAPDPAPPALPAIWIQEVLSNTSPPEQDAIEISNPTRAPVDISGWYLSDDFRTPRKYRFPQGTVLPPSGLWLVTEDAFNAPGPGAFGLSATGDEVYVFSADAQGRLTGYMHGFEFGPADPHMSFGLHALGGNRQAFVEQIEPTLGRPNRGPRVGPVVISEIMYAPATAPSGGLGEEFVELRNLTGEPVPLFDPARPESTWRLSGAVNLVFPPGIILPPHGHIVAVGFDPDRDLGRLLAFRQQYHPPDGLVLTGPWEGRLDKTSQPLRLQRPGQPRSGGSSGIETPYLLVEQVHYLASAPWPVEANGTGRSLARRFDGAYADDVDNWHAVVPSPGAQDTDGDGLPDDWELANGLNPYSADGQDGATGDPDRNGLVNRDAYRSGRPAWYGPTRVQCAVAPNDPDSVLLEFDAVVGRRYTVFSREARSGASWRLEYTAPAILFAQRVAVQLPRPDGARWYRVRVE
jgi:hypothetical protein